MNNYFVNVGPDLANKIEANTTGKSAKSYQRSVHFPDKRNTSSSFITPASNDEILKIFSKLKNCSPDWDGMRKNIFNGIFNIIANPLVHLMNLSLEQGIVFDELKLAQVIP